MSTLLLVFAGLFGLVFGSFMNVVVYRVPRKMSVSKPRSACPNCGRTLTATDNIPLISWLVLRGRCRSCKQPISIRYPISEGLTAVLWMLAAWRIGQCGGCRAADAVAFMILFWALLCLSLIDLEHKLIPNKILYPSLAAGIVALAVAAGTGPGWGTFLRAAEASAASFAVFNVIHLISPGGMGYGDVRLSALIGLYLGYIGWGRVYVGFLLGFLVGALGGLALMIVGKAGRKTAVPFGPFLAIGAIVSALWGGPIVRLWMR